MPFYVALGSEPARSHVTDAAYPEEPGVSIRPGSAPLSRRISMAQRTFRTGLLAGALALALLAAGCGDSKESSDGSKQGWW